MKKWNKNRFSIYDSEEKAVLELMDSLGKNVDELGEYVEGTFNHIDEKTIDYLKNEYDDEKLKDLINEGLFTDLNNEIKERFVNCYTLSDIEENINLGNNIFIPSNVNLEINKHITVNKPIKIVVEGTITQTKTKTCIFLVTVNGVIIEGGIYNGTSASTDNLPVSYASAVILDRVNDCIVRNMKIYNCSFAIGTDSGSGIYVTGGKNNLIENNYIEGCYHGINTDAVFNGTESQRNIIRRNKIVNCKFGYVMDLQGNDYPKHIGDIVEENIISNSLVNGLQVDDVNNGFIVRKNIIENSGQNGIVVMNRSGSGVIEENTSKNNGMCGIVLNHITSGHIISNVLIRKNSIKANETDGIQLYNVMGIIIESNDIFDNIGSGIVNHGGSYPQKLKLLNNEIAFNHGHGISLVDIRGCNINNNSIYYNSNENEGQYSGICIDRANITTSNIFINGNIFWGENSQTHKYCIEVKASSYDFIVVTNNQLQGAITGAISHSGSVKLKYNNGVEDLN